MKPPACSARQSLFFLIGLAAAALLSFPSAMAAGFDCTAATSRIENRICSSPKLSAPDDELDQVVNAATHIVSDPAALKKAQRQWIKGERDTFDEPEGIEAAYLAGMEELRLSPKTRGKLFARMAPPPSVFGRYSEKEPVCASVPDTDTIFIVYMIDFILALQYLCPDEYPS